MDVAVTPSGKSFLLQNVCQKLFVTSDASDFSKNFQLQFVIPGHFCLYLLLIPLPGSQICETFGQSTRVVEGNTSAWLERETARAALTGEATGHRRCCCCHLKTFCLQQLISSHSWQPEWCPSGMCEFAVMALGVLPG